jgi:predicted nucleotidyltransferase
MKTFGIVTEYNPFHLGHEWQLQEARNILGQDCAAVVVMSGSFTQRGEPGILDKWDRARAAMACGVNLVLELPHIYATASAGRFAEGSVKTLAATGIVQNLVFGSENGNLADLQEITATLSEDNSEFRSLLKTGLDNGLSWPAARQKAAESLVGADKAVLLEKSNNILAIEYLKALSLIPRGRRPKPLTIKRQGQDYTGKYLPEDTYFASASAIRQTIQEMVRLRNISAHDNLFSNEYMRQTSEAVANLAKYMPAPSLAILMHAYSSKNKLVLPEDLAPQIITMLRASEPELLDQFAYMQEGLGRRLSEAARRPMINDQDITNRLQTLLSQTDTRRFPRTRIQRALIAMLTQLKADDEIMISDPQYIRVLAFDKKGRHLLKLMRKYAELPVITRASDFLEHGRDSMLLKQASYDILATDIRSLASGGRCGLDFDTEVVIG